MSWTLISPILESKSVQDNKLSKLDVRLHQLNRLEVDGNGSNHQTWLRKILPGTVLEFAAVQQVSIGPTNWPHFWPFLL